MSRNQGQAGKTCPPTVTDPVCDLPGLERPPVDPHLYRYTLPPPYPDNPEVVQKYNDVNQFLARLTALFENDDPAIHTRLEQVAQVLRELEQVAQALEDMYALSPEVEAIALPLATQMRESITWGKAQLEAAMDRITSAVQTLKIDAVPGAKHRPGWTKGGHGRADTMAQIHADWQQKADAIWRKHPTWGILRVAKEIAPECLQLNGKPYSPNTIRERISKPQ